MTGDGELLTELMRHSEGKWPQRFHLLASMQGRLCATDLLVPPASWCDARRTDHSPVRVTAHLSCEVSVSASINWCLSDSLA